MELVEEDSDQAFPTEPPRITPLQLAAVPQPVAPQPAPRPPPVPEWRYPVRMQRMPERLYRRVWLLSAHVL